VAPRLQEVVVPGPPEDVLLRSAAALRRIGARLTRYDADTLTLEARVRRWGIATVITIAAKHDGETTRLEVESRLVSPLPFDLGVNAANVSHFASTLATTDLPPFTRRD